ncbi:MAG TPA: hypothetical protein VMT42_08040 [candidate division Zixibacteria bacterium]|nr:hypothetical protein [candidate division Zixibacteria bacterium]
MLFSICGFNQGEDHSSQSNPPGSGPSFPSGRGNARAFATLGVVCAVLSLIIVPEIFGAIAIILGAYTWRKEEGNGGLYIVIIGIICMLVGLYFTSLFELGDLLPSASSGGTSAMNAALGILA